MGGVEGWWGEWGWKEGLDERLVVGSGDELEEEEEEGKAR